MKNDLEKGPIRFIKGVGPRKAGFFRKLGIETISDLFYYLPRRYEDRSRVVGVDEAEPGETLGVIGKITKTELFRARTGTLILQVQINGASRRLFGVWYNQPYLKKLFVKGETAVFYGKVEVQKALQINHPAFGILEGEDLKASLDLGRIDPVYSLTEKLTQKYMRKTVDQAIRAHVSNAEEILPTRIRARRKLVDVRFAVENIHFPCSPDNLDRAYKRLVFEEFFVLQIIMALRRSKTMKKGIKHGTRKGLREELEELFSFELTTDQKRCIREIEKDMTADKPMYRLLQGDVGSGKTAVAMYALLLCQAGGFQGALMAPTEILARQHYVTISKTFMPLGLNVRLLISAMDAKDKEKVKKEIISGEADIVIGTHSLIQEGVTYKDLGLVVIDEQHKFGVEQRKKFMKKGKAPDCLVMTATPIPRSLALTVYGDMDVSLLREKPAGKEAVTTFWAEEERRDGVYDFIREEVKNGRQAFIVYPRISKDGKSDLRSAEAMYDHLKDDVFKDLRLGLVHGRVAPDKRKKVMDDFVGGACDILVSTTVIEVGVDIPNATVMLVENAERYGLSQLHQLRGRIGRGKHSSYCVLMGDPGNESSEQRISTMTETDDGFEIAEKDLDIRGPGEFLGTRQSGLPELRFGDIARDFSIMEEAREEAFALVEEDPGLDDTNHFPLKRYIINRFRGKLRF